MLRNNNSIDWHVADGAQTNSTIAPDVGIDGAWCTITAVVNTAGGQYSTKLCINGLLTVQIQMASNISLISPAPLVMGYWSIDFTGVFCGYADG